jgi:hypothetical protein
MIQRVDFQALARMRFVILPGSPGPDFKGENEQVTVYNYWKHYWQSLLDEINPGEKLNSEHFFDQDYVTAILDGDKVVAMQSIKHYNLKCGLKDHSVFKPFTADFFNFLEEKNISRVFTFRWFRVAEEYSPKAIGINMPAVICDLAHRIYDGFQAPDLAFVAHSRVDIAAANVAKKIGWFEVGERQMLHAVPCAQLVLIGDRGQYKPEVTAITNLFWNKRELFSSGKEIYETSKAA